MSGPVTPRCSIKSPSNPTSTSTPNNQHHAQASNGNNKLFKHSDAEKTKIMTESVINFFRNCANNNQILQQHRSIP